MASKCAIVTGAGSGIGLATVQRLIKGDYTVVGIDLDSVNLRDEFANDALTSGQLVVHDLDVCDEQAVGSAIKETLGSVGRIDALVNNAGIGIAATIEETPTDQWERILDVNLTGPFLLSRAVLPHMVEMGAGVIVNVSSVAALVGVRNRAAYCASKAGLLGLTRSIAVDYARHGIRAVAVCPGTVDSPWIQKILTDDPDPAARHAEMSARQLDGRLGSPDEVAASIAFLVSDDARFINGSAFVIDGGMTAI